jgi:hypothetical protein
LFSSGRLTRSRGSFHPGHYSIVPS